MKNLTEKTIELEMIKELAIESLNNKIYRNIIKLEQLEISEFKLITNSYFDDEILPSEDIQRADFEAKKIAEIEFIKEIIKNLTNKIELINGF